MSCFDAGRSWRQTLPLRLTTEGPHCQAECSFTGSEESGLAGWGAWISKWPTSVLRRPTKRSVLRCPTTVVVVLRHQQESLCFDASKERESRLLEPEEEN